jgi:hypothetical protein
MTCSLLVQFCSSTKLNEFLLYSQKFAVRPSRAEKKGEIRNRGLEPATRCCSGQSPLPSPAPAGVLPTLAPLLLRLPTSAYTAASSPRSGPTRRRRSPFPRRPRGRRSRPPAPPTSSTTRPSAARGGASRCGGIGLLGMYVLAKLVWFGIFFSFRVACSDLIRLRVRSYLLCRRR